MSSKFLLLNFAKAVLVSLEETPILSPPLINFMRAHRSVSVAIDRKFLRVDLISIFCIFLKILTISEILGKSPFLL